MRPRLGTGMRFGVGRAREGSVPRLAGPLGPRSQVLGLKVRPGQHPLVQQALPVKHDGVLSSLLGQDLQGREGEWCEC